MENATVDYGSGLRGLFIRNKPFIIVWSALFIAVAGIGMVSPLLPVFAEKMGASGIWLGMVFSGFAFSQVPLMPLMGRLADNFGKKPFIWVGLLIYTLSALGYIWAPGYHELVVFRILSGVGAAMVIPIAFSYIGELTPQGQEGRYMGLFNIALIAGFGIGPVLGGVVHDSFGMDATFAGMGLLSFLGFIIVVFLLPGGPSSTELSATAAMAGTEQPSGSFASILRDTTMRGVISFQMTYGLLFGTVLAFVGIWMRTTIASSVVQVGIVLSIRSLLNGALAYPFGVLADRFNRVILVTVGMLMMAIGTFMIPWMGSFNSILGLFMVIGFFESMAIPSVSAMTVEKGRRMGMGSVMGIINMAMSLGLVIGSLLGGVLEGYLGVVSVFRWAAVPGLAGVVAFNIFMIRRRRVSD